MAALRAVALVLAIFSVSLFYSARAADNRTYGALGASLVLPNWQRGMQLLTILNETSKPDSVKPMRKALLYARNGLDIFAFAFPVVPLPNVREERSVEKKKDPPTEMFRQLRDDLDQGYELVGAFQDLAGVNASDKERKKLLQPCLDWKVAFLKNSKSMNYEKFISSMSPTELYVRAKKQLAKDYWRLVDVQPKNTLSGLQNIALLANGQLQFAVASYTNMTALETIWKTEYHEQFHDYRKLLRAIYYLGDTIPAIYKKTVYDQLGVVDKCYGKFGKINDEVAEYSYLKDKGDKKGANKLKDQITADWDDFRKKMVELAFLKVLGNLTANLVPFS